MIAYISFAGEGNGTPLQYSCLKNPMDGGAWKAAVHGVAEGRTRLFNFTFTFHFHALEKEMATHSSVLAWRIPGTGEPGRLPAMGSHRVGHDWSDLAYQFCKAAFTRSHRLDGLEQQKFVSRLWRREVGDWVGGKVGLERICFMPPSELLVVCWQSLACLGL